MPRCILDKLAGTQEFEGYQEQVSGMYEVMCNLIFVGSVSWQFSNKYLGGFPLNDPGQELSAR